MENNTSFENISFNQIDFLNHHIINKDCEPDEIF